MNMTNVTSRINIPAHFLAIFNARQLYSRKGHEIAPLFLIYRSLHSIKELSPLERHMRVPVALSYLQFSPSIRVGFLHSEYISSKYYTQDNDISALDFFTITFRNAFLRTSWQFWWRICITIGQRLIEGCQFKDMIRVETTRI